MTPERPWPSDPQPAGLPRTSSVPAYRFGYRVPKHKLRNSTQMIQAKYPTQYWTSLPRWPVARALWVETH